VSRLLTEDEVIREGERLGRELPPGSVLLFRGQIGAGKTTLIKAIARGLGVDSPTSSPTYALVHNYQGRRGPVYHVDCYRLGSPEEAGGIDWEGMLAEGDAILVEWPERAGPWVPRATHEFTLSHVDDPDLRRLED